MPRRARLPRRGRETLLLGAAHAQLPIIMRACRRRIASICRRSGRRTVYVGAKEVCPRRSPSKPSRQSRTSNCAGHARPGRHRPPGRQWNAACGNRKHLQRRRQAAVALSAPVAGNTEYRIHGTNQPSTIGSFVSSGCVRLTNEDVEDLYRRVTVGTRVVVLPGANTATSQLRPRHKPRAMRSPEETGPSRGVRGNDPEGQHGGQLLRSDLPDLPL
jgi:hypothetical protein